MDELQLHEGPVLVIAPHPDDESLGCGRLLSSVWSAAGKAQVLCLTDGAASHPNSRSHPPRRLAGIRQDEMRSAVAILGGRPEDLHFLDLPDAQLHRVHASGDDLSRRIGQRLDQIGARTLVAPSPLDPHCDHEAAAQATVRVVAERTGLRLLFYPVWSRWVSHGHVAPVPARSRPVICKRGDVARKAAAIKAHASQLGRVVQDDPAGFVMPEGFAAFFAEAPELYFEVQS